MNLQKYSQLPLRMTAPTGQLDPHSAQMMYHQALTTAQIRVSNAWEPIACHLRTPTSFAGIHGIHDSTAPYQLQDTCSSCELKTLFF